MSTPSRVPTAASTQSPVGAAPSARKVLTSGDPATLQQFQTWLNSRQTRSESSLRFLRSAIQKLNPKTRGPLLNCVDQLASDERKRLDSIQSTINDLRTNGQKLSRQQIKDRMVNVKTLFERPGPASILTALKRQILINLQQDGLAGGS